MAAFPLIIPAVIEGVVIIGNIAIRVEQARRAAVVIRAAGTIAETLPDAENPQRIDDEITIIVTPVEQNPDGENEGEGEEENTEGAEGSEGETPEPPDPDNEDPDDEEDGDKKPKKEPEDPYKRPEGTPKDWEEKPSNNGEGTKWVDPENPHNDVRIQKGKPESTNQGQKQDYARWKKDGQWLDKHGNPSIDKGKTHIRLDEFKFDRGVFK